VPLNKGNDEYPSDNQAQIFQIRYSSCHLYTLCDMVEEFLVLARNTCYIRHLCQQKSELVLLEKQEKEESCGHRMAGRVDLRRGGRIIDQYIPFPEL
jgi:hypothetical protein